VELVAVELVAWAQVGHTEQLESQTLEAAAAVLVVEQRKLATSMVMLAVLALLSFGTQKHR
jgi:hypothetical protein